MRTKRVLISLAPCFDVHVITRAEEIRSLDGLEQSHVHIVRPERSVLWPIQIIPHIVKGKYDVVLCESDFFGFPVYYLLSRLLGYTVVFEAHGILSKEGRNRGHGPLKFRFNRMLEKLAIKKADFVIALSDEIREEYHKYRSDIILIPVFMEMTPSSSPKDAQTRKTIGIIGPFDTVRNRQSLEFLHTNIDRFDRELDFVVIGECRTRIDHPRIRYSGYIESFSDYIKTIAHLDAVLVDERIGTSGPLNKILEPMSVGVPVFTTTQGAIGLSNLVNSRDIFVVEEGNLVEIVNDTIRNRHLMQSVAENAKRYVDNSYDWQSNSRKLISVLNEAAHSSNRI